MREVFETKFIPKGFHHSAQRWTAQPAYAGWTNGMKYNLEKVEWFGGGDATRVGVEDWFGR